MESVKLRTIAMRCTQEEFESIKDKINYGLIGRFDLFPYLTNFTGDKISNYSKSAIIDDNVEIYETFDADIFLEACGIKVYKPQYQYLFQDEWIDVKHPIRIKPTPDYSKEIEALQQKAKENGMNVTINFEKI